MKNNLRKDNVTRLDWISGKGPAYENYYGQLYIVEKKICLWWRYTVLLTKEGEIIPRIWGALFYRDNPQKNLFLTSAVPEKSVKVDQYGVFMDSFGAFQAGKLRGTIGKNLSWNLTFEENKTSFSSVGSNLLASFLSKSRNISPNNNIFLSGQVTTLNEKYYVEQEPGHQGHTWGEIMPPGWMWAHCNAFNDKNTVIELIALDKGDKPALGSIFLLWGGKKYYFNRLEHLIGRQYLIFPHPKNNFSWVNGKLSFSGVENNLRIEGTIQANPAQYHLVRYTNSDGTFLYNLNDSVASLNVSLAIKKSFGWEQIAELYSDGAQIEFVTKKEPSIDETKAARDYGRQWMP